MSAETLELHHDKHHMAYITNGNKFIKEQNIADDNVNDIVMNSYQKNAPVFNNVAQHINHVHFWEVMKNNPDGKIPSELENKIVSDIGSVEKMKEDFINAGIGQFGSGWCWLVLNNGKLEITKTPNGENPIVHGHTPLLGCDVWEHSYYVDYRNRRPDYLKAFIDNLVNWEKVAENLNNA
jgi:Fe-Mn family superoxide dismutase